MAEQQCCRAGGKLQLFVKPLEARETLLVRGEGWNNAPVGMVGIALWGSGWTSWVRQTSQKSFSWGSVQPPYTQMLKVDQVSPKE